MLLDLKFSIGTLGIASGTLFSALYGMNLKNFIEESDLGFTAISTACFVLTTVVCAYGLKKLRKLQRVSMWGERGSGATSEGRGNWRDVDPATLGNGWESRYDRTRRLKDPASAARDAMRRGWLTGERERHGSMLKSSSERKGGDGSWPEPLPPAIREAKAEKVK
jgi:magnesium transporter